MRGKNTRLQARYNSYMVLFLLSDIGLKTYLAAKSKLKSRRSRCISQAQPTANYISIFGLGTSDSVTVD